MYIHWVRVLARVAKGRRALYYYFDAVTVVIKITKMLLSLNHPLI